MFSLSDIDWILLYTGIYGVVGSLVALTTKMYIPIEPEGREVGFRAYEKLGGILAFSLLFSSFLILIYNAVFHPKIEHPIGNLILIFIHTYSSYRTPHEVVVDKKFTRYYSLSPIVFVFLVLFLSILIFFPNLLYLDRIVVVTVFLSASIEWLFLSKTEEYKK